MSKERTNYGISQSGGQMQIGNAAVGNRATIQLTQAELEQALNAAQLIEPDHKRELRAAVAAVCASDLQDAQKRDVLSHLGGIQKELEQPKQDPSRIKWLLQKIQEAAPTVASILSSIATVARAATGT